MPTGVIEAAKEQGLLPRENVFTGGFDLLPENNKYIESGEMTASVGGHYFEAAWALVLIHDYLHGIDLGTQEITSFTTKMTSQTKDDFVKNNDIYTVLSKHLNPEVKKYNFDLDTFLQNSKKHL